MTDVFENYESDFNKIINQIERMLANMPNIAQDKKEKTLKDIKYELNEADLQIKQMDIEISSHPLHIKQQLQIKMKKYRNEWDSLRKKYVVFEQSQIDEDRRISLMDQKIELSNVESNGKERFIKTGAMMSDGSYKLKGALREIYQMESQANEISVNIYEQNKTIDKMIQDNVEISGNLSDSNKLVDRIKSNIRRNKLVLCIVSFIIILAITIIIWIKV